MRFGINYKFGESSISVRSETIKFKKATLRWFSFWIVKHKTIEIGIRWLILISIVLYFQPSHMQLVTD